MKYNGIIKKSRTLDFAALKAFTGGVIAVLPQAFNMSQDASSTSLYFGLGLMLLSGVDWVLRHKTTKPVNWK